MVAPFPEAQIAPLIYMFLGASLALLGVSGWYIRKLKLKIGQETLEEGPDLKIDNIGLSRRAEETLETVLDEPELQSDLPSKLNVSKATVSNAVNELHSRSLVKKKKKANTYLVEPHIENIEDEQR
ncbi:MAG: hypothetical protein H8Z69_05720 [Nanohaloarchaea archaeon]|nr:hypothetical protein [Candidatus Nanohaloarchaea archaeon]